MQVQKYWIKLNINELPFDGYDPTGGCVYYLDEKENSSLIGFISNWDIVQEIVTITLFESLSSQKYPRLEKMLKNENIIREKLTKKEVKNDIKKAISIPFEKWMISAVQGEKNG